MPSVERKDDTGYVHSLRSGQEHHRLRQVFWSSEQAGGDLGQQLLTSLGRVVGPPGSVLGPRDETVHRDPLVRNFDGQCLGQPHYARFGCGISSGTSH